MIETATSRPTPMVVSTAPADDGTGYDAFGASAGLDEDIATVFSLQPTSEPVTDLSGYAATADKKCTDNGCTDTCRTC